jgi:hypothetical protein
MKTQSTHKTMIESAKRYVDEQLATMHKHGSRKTKLSTEQYQILLKKVVSATAK